MTDTTDIKAMREQWETLNERLDLDIFITTVLTALEAERQRAEAAEARVKELEADQVPDAIKWRWKADEHSSAGAWIYIDIKEKFDAIKNIEGAEWQCVFTASQKPVVLPKLRKLPDLYMATYHESKGFNEGVKSSKTAIEVAGGIVKDGE